MYWLDKIKKEDWFIILISVIVNIAIASMAIFLFGTRLYMDDDNILSWMTYGIITEASSRTFYTNVILGWLYKHLFSLIPCFNWQTLVFYLGMVFAGTMGLYAVIKTNKKKLVLLWILFELTFFYDAYILLTFSVVSAYVACQGYLALFLSSKAKEKSFLIYLASGLSIIFSSLVRIDSFLGISGFAFFLWVIFVVLEYKDNQNLIIIIRKYVYPFGVIIGVCFMLFGLDRAAYAKGEWREYKDYESVRLVLTDYRNSVSLMHFDELEKLGINASMGRAIAEWRNNDPEILTKEVLDLMATTNKDYNYFGSCYVWNDYFVQMGKILKDYYEVYYSIALLMFVMFMVWKQRGQLRQWMPFFLAFVALGELFYFSYIGRIDGGAFPERCVYIVFMGLSMSLIVFCSLVEQEKEDGKIKQILLGLIIVSAFMVQTTKDYTVNGLGLVDTDSIQREYGFLGNNEKVYVCEYDVRQQLEESYGAWQTPPSGFMDHAIVIGSWLINHPMQIELQQSLGCDNPYRALFENDNVYYIRYSCSDELILEYLRENYDDRINREYVKEKGRFKVFKYYIDD